MVSGASFTTILTVSPRGSNSGSVLSIHGSVLLASVIAFAGRIRAACAGRAVRLGCEARTAGLGRMDLRVSRLLSLGRGWACRSRSGTWIARVRDGERGAWCCAERRRGLCRCNDADRGELFHVCWQWGLPLWATFGWCLPSRRLIVGVLWLASHEPSCAIANCGWSVPASCGLPACRP